ncbi:MAG TPA: glycosyltransferase [Verrucomicrobiae bacterium]|nr:glycosyltransferase [Verrucomicrobiae bacterium]
MIRVFTPSLADEADTNAQNLSVKEIAARLDPAKTAITMLHIGAVDPRIAARPNTTLLRWRAHGNTPRIVLRLLTSVPDVYFFPREGPLDAAFLRLRRSLGLKTAVVTYVVSGGLYNPEPPRPTLARNVREADLVFGNCRYLGALVRERMGVNAGIRYDGIDRRFFYPPAQVKSGGELIVLFAGSLRGYKRADLVVRQAARWPQIRFRILGRGEEEQRCRDMAASLGCSNVDFVGHLSSQQVGEEMRRADVFFLPSIVEGHPQVLAQAAACGLPAVAMNLYRPEFVIHQQTGFLADSDEELQQQLDTLLTQPELRRTMGRAAAQHSLRFDWDEIAGQWQEAFEEAIRKRRQR